MLENEGRWTIGLSQTERDTISVHSWVVVGRSFMPLGPHRDYRWLAGWGPLERPSL
jgi:hypothetical protein